MNWKKSIEGALVAAGAAVFAGAAPLLQDGLTQPEVISMVVTFGSVFFAYLKTHQPKDVAE